MWWPKSPVVFVLGRQDLRVFDGKSETKVTFPPEAINDLEIKDRVATIKLIGGLVSEPRFKNREALVFLTPEVVFERAIIKDENLESGIKKFTEEIPFPTERLLINKIDQQSVVLVLVINNDWPSIFKEVIEPLGVKLAAIVPLSPLGYKEFSPSAVTKKNEISQFSFNQASKDFTNRPNFPLIVLGLILGLMVAAV